MTSILEEPAVRRVIYPLSVEFYHQAGELGLLGEDVELLEGMIVHKMPKSPLHESSVEKLYELLRQACPRGSRVFKERPLTCARSEPEPDVSVVRGNADDFRRSHPSSAELVIEVAVSTLEVDRRKAAIYCSAGVKEYWIVIPEERRVEVHCRPEGEIYLETHTAVAPARLESTAVAGFSVDLAQLFQP